MVLLLFSQRVFGVPVQRFSRVKTKVVPPRPADRGGRGNPLRKPREFLS